MANEATIRVSLNIRKDNLNYQSQPTSFLADVSGSKGPSPGAITVTNTGAILDLSQLEQPGLCHIRNLSTTGYLELGVWDPQALISYPLMELLPGESFVFRWSRNLLEQYGNTGTGTTGPENYVLLRGVDGTTTALVETFEA